MIPRDYITAWRSHAPWIDDAQVEQDLVITRALVELYSHPVLQGALAFRGGTALYKLYLKPAARYSEDIDLVQVNTGPAGPIMAAMREALDHWLGVPRWKQSEGRVTFDYRFQSEDTPSMPLKLKIEINTREHFAVQGHADLPFAIESRWFQGSCKVKTFELNELLGTKLRALYQRRKGRDLFDLATALEHPQAQPDVIVMVFSRYMAHSGQHVTRRQFEENLEAKLDNRNFKADIGPLLATGYEWNMARMADIVNQQLISRLPS